MSQSSTASEPPDIGGAMTRTSRMESMAFASPSYHLAMAAWTAAVRARTATTSRTPAAART